MNGEQVRALKDEEIAIELKKSREKLFRLRSQSVTEKVEDVSSIGKVRRDVARLLTEIRSRELAGQSK
ncbi:MAG: 50S ribosomal protein L29 [Phycisphaeraceae bacterium]|nr:50S ribosomal protein L29 [Phycisphaeraceae bacterium]MCW5762965.1 50S ribosomal protein L29 [Phycisphaeraceae bacterium]